MVDEGLSQETLRHALSELQTGVSDNAELSEHVAVLSDALARSAGPTARVVWERDCCRGRYRVVAAIKPGDSYPSKFIVERGHVDATGAWSWNRSGESAPRRVFSAIMSEFFRLIEANGPGAADPPARTPVDVTRPHAATEGGGA